MLRLQDQISASSVDGSNERIYDVVSMHKKILMWREGIDNILLDRWVMLMNEGTIMDSGSV